VPIDVPGKVKRVLVTGGLGYIGSHTCVELLAQGLDVLIVDNLSCSDAATLEPIRALGAGRVELVCADLREPRELEAALGGRSFEAVVHFAALKSAPQSLERPLEYYENNVVGSLNLLRLLERRGIERLVFSSSAAVYGEPLHLPIDEAHALAPTTPYASSKAMTERAIADAAHALPRLRFAILRYFNAAGAHPSGRLREDAPRGSTNLMPAVTTVAAGEAPVLEVYGGDYATHDGSCVRDYVHVADLAEGHVAALRYLERGAPSLTINLGTGRGVSVLELARAFERANNVTVPLRMRPRRAGDVAAVYADVRAAREALGWAARRDLATMCRDAWRSRRAVRT
jgi:UDP-glucose 4-epimerase